MTARPGTGRAGACKRASVAVRRCASSGGSGRLRARGRAFVPGAGGSPSEAFGRFAARVRAFVDDTRAGATAIAAAAVTVMTVGASALIIDHVWLVDQRDVLKTAADAAAIAATLEIDRQLEKDPGISDEDLKAALYPVAARYVFHNLLHLPDERLKRAAETIKVEIAELDRAQRTVKVTAEADLGGTLFSRALPLLGNYEGPETTVAHAGVDSESTPVEVVLAIDVSNSMGLTLKGGTWAHLASNSRMGIVKRAAKELVTVLEPDAYSRVAVGIVPWDISVRLDAHSASAWTRKRWARYPDKRTYPYPWKCGTCVVAPVVDDLPDDPPSEWRGCLEEYRVGAGDTASLPDATAAALFATPARSPFAQHFFPSWPVRAYRDRDASEWPTGALFLSYQPYETQPRLAQDGCSADHPTLFALSTERAAVERAIDALSPAESVTYSSLGVLWAQRMLEPDWKSVWGGAVHPADPATPGHAGLRKAIVLLTDGNDSYCEFEIQGVACADVGLTISRADACAQAKARGTEIFVVAAMNPRGISGALGQGLRACSSESDDAYPEGTRRPGATYVFLNNEDPQSLEAAFADIAKQLRTLRKVS